MTDFTDYLRKLKSGERVDNPFLYFMGMHLEEIREGYARFSLAIRPEFIQGAGIMQGGLSIAFSSEVAAHAAMTVLLPGESVTTIELKNNFLSMAKGGKLVAESTIFKKGRSLIIVDTIVRDDNGSDISRSSATLMIIRDNG